jgi:hypothetical protein
VVEWKIPQYSTSADTTEDKFQMIIAVQFIKNFPDTNIHWYLIRIQTCQLEWKHGTEIVVDSFVNHPNMKEEHFSDINSN